MPTAPFSPAGFQQTGAPFLSLPGRRSRAFRISAFCFSPRRIGRPVYVKDVADVVVGAAEADHRAWTMTRAASGKLDRQPAVSLAIAKRKGENAVNVAAGVLRRLETIRGRIVPASLDVEVTRNYGETANEKANELLFHLESPAGFTINATTAASHFWTSETTMA